jgi:protein PhnA
MIDILNCPECSSEYVYEDGNMFVCPECAHDIDCKVDGIGPMKLKSQFVKKA